MTIAFPILQLSNDSIAGFRDEASFRHAVSLTTDKAIRAGFFEKVRLIDSNLVDYRVRKLELTGKSGFFSWMKQGREIAALDLTLENQLDLSELKALLSGAIKGSAFWAENEDVDEVLCDIEGADSFSSLLAIFG
jgi:hypothetical protein